MAVTIIRGSANGPAKKKSNGHTKAVPPTIPLDQPGRLRTGHLMSIFSVSHSTLCAGRKSGRYPKEDGYDGKMPYWNTETVRVFLQGGNQK